MIGTYVTIGLLSGVCIKNCAFRTKKMLQQPVRFPHYGPSSNRIQYGTPAKIPGTITLPSASFTPSSVSLIDLAARADSGSTPVCESHHPAGENSRWHKVQTYLAHLFAKARHLAVSHGKRSIRGHVATCRTRSAGSQHQMTAHFIHQLT